MKTGQSTLLRVTGRLFKALLIVAGLGNGSYSYAVSPASLEVRGNTILFQDLGWWQVLTQSDYRSVCEDARRCEVPNGTYLVINHTSGDRFTSIEVPGRDTTNPYTEVLELPDDGWYQVQDAYTYATVCEGVASCTLSTGSYIIINHTSRERSFLEVTGEDRSDQVRVNGNTIAWPDDGWYEVQSVGDYSSVCQGGRYCVVLPGDYVVINHDTGTRTPVGVQ